MYYLVSDNIVESSNIGLKPPLKWESLKIVQLMINKELYIAKKLFREYSLSVSRLNRRTEIIILWTEIEDTQDDAFICLHSEQILI